MGDDDRVSGDFPGWNRCHSVDGAGGKEIAVESSRYIKDHDVIIWAHHGMFCSGEDFDQTFGLAHTVEKAAEILCKVLAVTPVKRQTIPAEGFRKLGEAFQVSLPEKFLYEK